MWVTINKIHLYYTFKFTDDKLDEEFLLKSKPTSKKVVAAATKKSNANRAQSADALQQRLETMKNKIGSKKSKPSERTIKKRQLKKLKKDKEFKKKIVSVAKSLKNEKAKEEKFAVKDEADSKTDVKPKPVFNEEGKMVFSKFQFAAQASRAKKGKNDSKFFFLYYSNMENLYNLFSQRLRRIRRKFCTPLRSRRKKSVN